MRCPHCRTDMMKRKVCNEFDWTADGVTCAVIVNDLPVNYCGRCDLTLNSNDGIAIMFEAIVSALLASGGKVAADVFLCSLDDGERAIWDAIATGEMPDCLDAECRQFIGAARSRLLARSANNRGE